MKKKKLKKLKNKVEDLEARLKDLELRYPIVTWTETCTDNTEPTQLKFSSTCATCGMEFSDVPMAYVCSRYDCPAGVTSLTAGTFTAPLLTITGETKN